MYSQQFEWGKSMQLAITELFFTMSPKADIAFDILLAQRSSEELRNRLLEALQEDNSMFCIDVPRLSLASNLEQAKIDIKDREAFANDIKKMLMSFIDEEDIDDD